MLNKNQNQKSFSSKAFSFFIINYIIGFGFISTIFRVTNLNYYGIIVLVVTYFMTLATALVFSKLGNHFKEEYGGSYAYAKKVNKKLAFFVGWTQFAQIPVLASTAPLFLASAINNSGLFEIGSTLGIIIRLISFLLFFILVVISTLNIKTNKYVILVSAIIKWITLAIFIALAMYLGFANNSLAENFANNQFAPFAISQAIVSFMYAFGGIEDIAAMIGDAKVKNFRKILMSTIAFIMTFYLVGYLIIINVDKEIMIASRVFERAIMIPGLIIFLAGTIFNLVAGRLSVTITTVKKIVPLAEDGYLFAGLTKKNSFNNYGRAVWFNAVFIIAAGVVFFFIETFIPNMSNFFRDVIDIGVMFFLTQYFLTFFIAFALMQKKLIPRIALWERIIYVIGAICILTTLVIFMFPMIVGEQLSELTIIRLAIFFGIIALGYVFQAISAFYKKNHPKKQPNQLYQPEVAKRSAPVAASQPNPPK